MASTHIKIDKHCWDQDYERIRIFPLVPQKKVLLSQNVGSKVEATLFCTILHISHKLYCVNTRHYFNIVTSSKDVETK